MCEDARSVTNLETSKVTFGGSRPRRTQRTNTTFHLAHPAPTLAQKQRLFHIRPRRLLQLQRLSPDSRPEPAVDVIPSAIFIPRLAHKFPRMFRRKTDLGINDVMVVQSEENDSPDDPAMQDTESDEENLADRDLIAVICQMPKDAGGTYGKTEIVLSDGSLWVATPLPNGLYEFVSVDENGNKTTARWVKRSSPRYSGDFTCSTSSSSGFKYTFSIINPNSRRHPIMGSITQNTLDIPHFYTSVLSSAKKYPPTTHIWPVPGESEFHSMENEPIPERTTHAIDEDMKKLIQVTGIWVALRQGLSPYFKYNDAMANISATTNSRTASYGRVRSVSLMPDASRPSIVRASSESSHSTLADVGGKIQRTSTNGATPTAPSPQLDRLNAPKRSASTGIAFMQRVAARRTGMPRGTVQSDGDAESVLRPPKRAVTEKATIAIPPSLNLPGLSTITPDIPTRPQPRAQPACILSSLPQTGHTIGSTARHSVETVNRDEDKPKIVRWKTFTNLFQKPHTRSA